MKNILFYFVFVSCVSFGQNKSILYDFAGLPQNLMLNPGAAANFKFHIGIPLVSGFSAEVGSSNFVLSDLFLNDNIDFTNKFNVVLNRLSARDHIKINTQIEILNGGFRLNDKTYLSFGFYEEFDAISYYPKDVAILLNEGNSAYLNRSFSLSQLQFKADLVGVLHAGISREINEKFTIGGRFKIYSGTFNAKTTNNTGTFTTVSGKNTIYTHYLNSININIETSGISNKGERLDDTSNLIENTFLNGNFGLGLDAGFTYKMSKQLEVSGSILDFGFINHSKNVANYTAKGNFIFDGVNFKYDAANATDYWGNIDEAFKEQLPYEENYDSYISWRPTKINGALKYSFGEQRSRYCYDNTYKDFYNSAVGFHLFTIFRPLSPQVALTGFYERALSKKIFTKFTYTIDDYSFSNFGAGLSAQLGPFNIYGTAGNLLEFVNLADAKNISFQFGLNLIFS